MDKPHIVVAGATGDLGSRIVRELLARHANVTALVRHGSTINKLEYLKSPALKVIQVDFTNQAELEKACVGASCVVSALAGLRDVVLDAQRRLLDAAVSSGIARFIPSDFSIDFTKTTAGKNRNLDLRRDFHEYLYKARIAPTSIYNGAFTSLLNGKAPIILFKIKRILYWQDPDQKMDFTTIDDTAAYTAAVALDSSTPPSLHIAGDTLTMRDLAENVSKVTGDKFKIMRAGSLKLLSAMINITRVINPASHELYPAWQGMQYLRDMTSGVARVNILNNDRYSDLKWQSVYEYLSKTLVQGA